MLKKGVIYLNSKEKERALYWRRFSSVNQAFISEQYERYIQNETLVDEATVEIFEKYGTPTWLESGRVIEREFRSNLNSSSQEKVAKAIALFDAVRRHGHLAARLFSVGEEKDRTTELIKPETYGLTEEDLREIHVHLLDEDYPMDWEDGWTAYKKLLDVYTGTTAYEFEHVNNNYERNWLTNQVEVKQKQSNYTKQKQIKLLKRLIEIVSFEKFLQRTFMGQKRFSIEGLDMLVPMLDSIVEKANKDHYDHMLIGMAHRGRLNVLAHVLGKPLDIIFSEFHKAPEEELVPNEGLQGMNEGWSGDVKYHFGLSRKLEKKKHTMKITLAPNPSHLEYVNPVVLGTTRAAQDNRTKTGFPLQSITKACNVLIHGDAAFIGEGIVAETLNLSNLTAYKTGGSIHFIANNLLGFTTTGREGRSTRYASDLAKGFEIPIIHVNADDPFACLKAIELAYAYQQKFSKDVLIDLVGYRRYGHNEMDEPRTTQPLLYKEIDAHPRVTTILKNQLIKENLINEDDYIQMEQEAFDKLQAVYDGMKEAEEPELEIGPLPKALTEEIPDYETSVPEERLWSINKELLNLPENFQANEKLMRILKRNQDVFVKDQMINWALAEALAYGTILQEGVPIRITGQDAERGTFAHRHFVLHDVHDGKKLCRMHQIAGSKASFEIRNSPLSEAAALGFEYGYSVQAKEALVIWEAQFGDFINVAQVIIDQFIASSRAKWAEISDLVMLLPHGYEGQGPEHSSARLERFLQLVAENNFIIANITTSAQFFHLLRRQAKMTNTEAARPLVVMTPKGFLRNPMMDCSIHEFTNGRFQELIQHKKKHHDLTSVKRLLIGTGKIMLEIISKLKQTSDDLDWLEIVRLEQIYPFPENELYFLLKKWPNLEEIVWVQEEPRNMGPWMFVQRFLNKIKPKEVNVRYIGRPSRSSPAVGEPNIHHTGQRLIIEAAISKEIRSVFL